MAVINEGTIAVGFKIVEIKQGENTGKFQAHVELSGTGIESDLFYFGRACDTRGEALSWAVAYAFDKVKID